MIRLTILVLMITMVRACDYTMDMVWQCSSRAFRYHDHCVTARDLHRFVRLRGSPLVRPTILLKDGFYFQKLFQDCDTDRNKCISKDEALAADKCTRDCKWKKAWIDTFCSL